MIIAKHYPKAFILELEHFFAVLISIREIKAPNSAKIQDNSATLSINSASLWVNSASLCINSASFSHISANLQISTNSHHPPSQLK